MTNKSYEQWLQEQRKSAYKYEALIVGTFMIGVMCMLLYVALNTI